MVSRVSGVFAALATPSRQDGAIDFDGVDRLLELVLAAEVDGVCVGGATAEYVHFGIAERAALTGHVAARLRDGRLLLTSIGASSLNGVLELGRRAIQAGSDALLLPMPHFFRYQQDDLQAFCRVAAQTLEAPCLLYNLPSFTNPLKVETSAQLLRSVPYLIGIKDSSGDRTALSFLAQLHGGAKPVSLLVGNDEIIEAALRAGWDGVISGIASFCPELIVNVHRSLGRADEGAARHWLALLDQLIHKILKLPIPWAIRAGLEVRDIPMGPFALPLSAARARQVDHFVRWFRIWFDEHLDEFRPNRPAPVTETEGAG